MKTTVFGFTDKSNTNITAQILGGINTDFYCLLDCTSIDTFNLSLHKLKTGLFHSDKSRVIGLGQYSGRDADRIRLESNCRNKFRNSEIVNGGVDSYPMTLDAQVQNIKIADGIGNSWCNLACYELSTEIIQTDLNVRLYFLHIPKTYPIKRAVSELKVWITK